MSYGRSLEIPFERNPGPGQTAQNEFIVCSLWDGTDARSNQHFRASVGWNEQCLSVCFRTRTNPRPIVSRQPVTSNKTIGLWERDVCEVFIAPDRNEPRKYFEFEVAPTGEWLDLAIDMTSGERVTDWEYASGMEATGRIENDRVLMALRIPWEAFGRKPVPGDIWLGNIFRCVGREPDRGYLAWQPTMTDVPNFHVPEKFGEFQFR
jgi:alpha-galactosidase